MVVVSKEVKRYGPVSRVATEIDGQRLLVGVTRVKRSFVKGHREVAVKNGVNATVRLSEAIFRTLSGIFPVRPTRHIV